jgi:hypothetical protein
LQQRSILKSANEDLWQFVGLPAMQLRVTSFPMAQYQPNSLFLLDILAGVVPLSGGEFGEANLARLIALTRDEDLSNRDWATFLLAQQERNTPDVREALLAAAADENEDVRAEAIWGLAHIARDLALPLVSKALAEDYATVPIFEAAELLAHPSLVDALRPFANSTGDTGLNRLVNEALSACEAAAPAYPSARE